MLSRAPTYEDAELGALVREAKELGASAVSLSEHVPGYCRVDLFLHSSNESPGAVAMVAMVHATGEGSTNLEAMRDAVAKLRMARQLVAPKESRPKVLGPVEKPRVLDPAEKLPRLMIQR